MRIVVWNCNMALHRKWEALTALRPDLAILPEAAAPDVLDRKGTPLDDVSTVWAGKSGGSANKGLLVAGFGGLSVERVPEEAPLLDIFLPVRISGRLRFDALTVWSFNRRSPVGRDRSIIAKALDRYGPFLRGGALMGGDFNHSVRWDRGGAHDLAPSLTALSASQLRSAYHVERAEAFGSESLPTLYWRDRREDGPSYHIDYLFEPPTWRAARRSVSLGSYVSWVAEGLSDHVPLICDYDETMLNRQSIAA